MRAGRWGTCDTTAFAPIPLSGLSRIDARGGPPEVLTALASEDGDADRSHGWPDLLPGESGVVYARFRSDGTIDIAAKPLETGERRGRTS